jgi:hypothetical protein
MAETSKVAKCDNRGAMKHFQIIRAIALAGAISAPALAQSDAVQAFEAAEPAASPAYAVPVEPLSLGKGRGGLMTVAFTAAGYNFSSATSVEGAGGATIKVFGSTKSKKKVVVKYRVLKEGKPYDAGTCSVTARLWSGLWNSTENSLYTCNRKPGSAASADFALEAVVPDIPLEGGGTISISSGEPIDYAVLRARMRYDGVVYEAHPTELDPKLAQQQYRVAKGWLITRDGKPVGRLDFAPRDKGFSDFMGSHDRKSIIIAPVNPADGREAVVTFAAHLMFLPEANSPMLITQ